MDFMRAMDEYMKFNNLNRRQLAEKLKCSPSYISQILNGDTNLSMEKLYDIALSIGKVPLVRYEDLDLVLLRDEIQCESSYEVDSTVSDSVSVNQIKPTRQFSIVEHISVK
jgi:transcriptional regulator with XRE-family HTH domain